MAFDTQINLDANSKGFSLPTDSCVGDAGPTPEQVTQISGATGGGKNFPTIGTVPVGSDRDYTSDNNYVR